MFFFMMILLFFVVRAVAYGGGMRCMPVQRRGWQPHRIGAPPRPRLNAFERLKQRYVSGEITDEQYESELDVLLRGRETRKLVP